MIVGLYYFDLGLLECNETKLRKAKQRYYNKMYRERQKKDYFCKP
jgi:hypothetical protein